MAIIYPKKASYSVLKVKGHPSTEEVFSKVKKMEYPLDIKKLIKDYGIEILQEDMDHAISGYIERRQTGWVIGVNKYHSEQRQRFTLAHEFAHYILHSQKVEEKHQDQVLFRTNEVNSIEVEANDFAGELLIPQEKFKQFISEGISKIGELSDRFNVSISAIRYKAYKLGYLNRV